MRDEGAEIEPAPLRPILLLQMFNRTNGPLGNPACLPQGTLRLLHRRPGRRRGG
ncbi:hypothetical protein ACFQ7J_07445 [Streptomyces sp. NPDC056501]|uniref:hypothetical protein n=1 Tax=Streptomyces sp. NPDC056501 TaxID=3345841 RepID=UPI0036763B78